MIGRLVTCALATLFLGIGMLMSIHTHRMLVKK